MTNNDKQQKKQPSTEEQTLAGSLSDLLNEKARMQAEVRKAYFKEHPEAMEKHIPAPAEPTPQP